jgi:hypothetical protein
MHVDSFSDEDSTKATEQRQKLQKMLNETLKKVELNKAMEEKGGAVERTNEVH